MGIGMGQDHRRTAGGRHRMGCLDRGMGHIDDDAEPVEFGNQFMAESGNAAGHRLVGGGINPWQRAVVAQRDQPDAQLMPHAHGSERAFAAHGAFHRHERADLALSLGGGNIGGAADRHEHIRVACFDPPDQVDLFEGDGGGMRNVAGQESRHHLHIDHACLEARNIGVGFGVYAGEIIGGKITPRGLADDPGQIIVAIDQDGLPEHVNGPLVRGILSTHLPCQPHGAIPRLAGGWQAPARLHQNPCGD